MRWLACFLFLCDLLSLLGSFTFQRFFLFIQSSNSKKKYQSIEYTFSVKIRFEFPQMCSNNEGSKVFTVQNFFFDWFNDWSLYCGIKKCTMLTSFELTCWWNSVFIKKKIKRMQKLYYENEARFCSLFFGTAIYGDMKKEGKKQNFVFAQIEQFCTNAKSNFLLSFIYSNTHSVNSVWMFFFRSILWCKEYFFSMGKPNTTQPNP